VVEEIIGRDDDPDSMIEHFDPATLEDDWEMYDEYGPIAYMEDELEESDVEFEEAFPEYFNRREEKIWGIPDMRDGQRERMVLRVEEVCGASIL
jgi:hypothetical protein